MRKRGVIRYRRKSVKDSLKTETVKKDISKFLIDINKFLKDIEEFEKLSEKK